MLEIAEAIQNLPTAEVRQLYTWLQTYLDEQWDQQIVQDVEAGRLDYLIARAEDDIKAHNNDNRN